jgi:spore coat polysaccharide biosynthesis protein SpsF (cytidylyltransferase family)
VGLSAYVLSRRSIELCNTHLHDPAWRYEIGIYIRNSARFKARGVNRALCLCHYMWTVDWPEDVPFMQKIFDVLQNEGEIFGLEEVLDFLASQGKTSEGPQFKDPWPIASFRDPWPPTDT